MISPRTLALPVVLVAAVLLAPSARSQGRGGHAFAPPVGARQAQRVGGPRGRGFPGSAFLPFPYYPYYYPEDNSGYWPPAAPANPPYQVVVAPPAQPTPPAPPVQPLLMEERAGQWVRVPTGAELPTAAQGQAASPQTSSSPAAPAVAAQQPVKLPSAMIVFRDGHMEEVAKYTIQGNILYTSADYWSTGSWTKKIRVADIDVPATLKINEQRGAKFDLPSGPSEIMVRF
jgi:hypothetical protein